MVKSRRAFLFVFLSAVIVVVTAQNAFDYHLELLSNPPSNCTSGFNDVWGFQHSNGTNYALLGTKCGTEIYALTDPSNPQHIIEIPGAFGTWRDIKNFGDYIYVVADQGNAGLQIIDMTNPDPAGIKYWSYYPKVEGISLARAHNLYIDSQGLIYLAGANIYGGGVLIFDASTHDSLPPLIGKGLRIYAHDVYVNEARDLMITSDIYSGDFKVHTLDRQPDTVSIINTVSQETGFTFTHNTWTTDDGDVVFTTDERSGASVEVYDISDLDEILFLDSYAPLTAPGNTLPHNVHLKGNHLVVSYYSEGIKILDVSRPHNIVEVGSYDTDANGGSGSWGAFPFFDNDLVLGSDINNGLFVFQPDYTPYAAWLEGTIFDGDGFPLEDVLIEVMSFDSITELNGSNGNYAVAIVDPSSLPSQPGLNFSNLVTVRITKNGYHPIEVGIHFVPDSVIQYDFILQVITLPVELISFTLEQDKCEDYLRWQVGEVLDHSHFELEQSSDGFSFTPIQSFFSVHDQSVYIFNNDVSHTDAPRYYRLAQYDVDGTITHSSILFGENICQPAHDFLLFPNPAFDNIYLQAEHPGGSVQIFDQFGKRIDNFYLEASLENNLSLEGLAPGVYFFEYTNNTIKEVEKVMIVP
ncbi:MAG: choice-of-anchor B family protein [Saprospiraceae bacterium]|nr:choice-of-anchor B family protein [Saprospiraceae bacterium]